MLRIMLIGGLTLMAHTALAQEMRLPVVPQAAQSSSGGMMLREVVIEGRKLLTPQDLAGLDAGMVGTSIDLQGGLELMRRLKRVYRQAGYGDITVRLDVNRFADGRVVLVVDESRAILRPAMENPRPPLKLPAPPHEVELTPTPVAPIETPVETPPVDPVAPAMPATPAPELPQVTPLREAAKNIYLIDEPKAQPVAPASMPEVAPVVPVIVPEAADLEKTEALMETPTAPTVVAPVQEAPKVAPIEVPTTPEVEAETIVERPAEEAPKGVVEQTIQNLKKTLFGDGEKAAEE